MSISYDVKYISSCPFRDALFEEITPTYPNRKTCFETAVLLKKEYDKYPHSLRSKLQTKVIWYETLVHDNINYFGTYNPCDDIVYIKNTGNNYEFYQEVFHHELSSIIFYHFPSNALLDSIYRINPTNFNYNDPKGRGKNAINNDLDNTEISEDWNKDGFVNQYATSHIENDYNEICKFLFTGNPLFWNAYHHHPKLRQKTDLIIGYFNSVDSSFNITYFQSLIPSR